MILEAIFILLAIPTGFLIAWMARDELVDGRKWFYAIIALSLTLSVVFAVLKKDYASLSLVFIAIVAIISLRKSGDRKWTKKHI